MLWLYMGWGSTRLMRWLSSFTLHVDEQQQRWFRNRGGLTVWWSNALRWTWADWQCVVDWAGEVLGAEAGQQLYWHVWQEGHQFDLKPQLDELGVVQVLLSQRRRFFSAENLPEVSSHLAEVLHEEHSISDWTKTPREKTLTQVDGISQLMFSPPWPTLWPGSSDVPSVLPWLWWSFSLTLSGWSVQHIGECRRRARLCPSAGRKNGKRHKW